MVRLLVSAVVFASICLADHALAQSTDLYRLLNLGTQILRDSASGSQDQPAPQPQYQPQYQAQPQPARPVAAATRDEVAEAQDLLGRLGYDAGPVDGLMGRKTAAAIRDFERDQGLPVTGAVSDRVLAYLRRASGTAGSSPREAAPRAQASFDCRKATTETERAICASDRLAGLDREVAAAYGSAVAAAGPARADAVRGRQRAWLRERDRCGAGEDCLAAAMSGRLAELQAAPADVAPSTVVEPAAMPAPAVQPGRAFDHFAYIALRNAAQVAVVDIDHGEIVARIPVGPLPRGTTSNADGSLVAAVNDGDRTISLIDTAANEVVETLDFHALVDRAFAGQDARAGQDADHADKAQAGNAERTAPVSDHGGELDVGNVALSPDGRMVYIAPSWFGIMSYDRQTGAVGILGDGHANDQPLGPTNGVLKLSPDGSKIFVRDFSHQGLSIIDTERMMLTGSLPGLEFGAFEISPDGRFVASFYQDVQIGDLETFEVRRITGGKWRRSRMGSLTAAMIDGIEISPDGRTAYSVRAVDKGGGTLLEVYEILAIDLQTGAQIGSAPISEKSPDGLSLTADGTRLVITVPATNTLRVYDAHSLALTLDMKLAPTPMGYSDFVISRPSDTVAEPAAGVAEGTAADATARNDDPALVARAQRLLNQNGYDAGAEDGAFGRTTRRAILEFELDHGLEPSGAVSLALIDRLEAASGGQSAAASTAKVAAAGHSGGGVEGVYCTSQPGLNVLALEARGSGMAIGVSSWQGGMHHCGITGNAAPAGDGWVLTDGGCQVTLRRDDDRLTVAAEPQAACAAFCGARARLDGLAWPMSSRTSQAPGALLANPESLFNYGCQ